MKNEIFENVRQVIHDSIGISKTEIKPESTLFYDLPIDSIDFIDILYELETMYDIEINASSFEEKVREELGDKKFEVDGVITPEGLKKLREYMMEINKEELVEGLTVSELIKLINVQTLCNVIEGKIQKDA